MTLAFGNVVAERVIWRQTVAMKAERPLQTVRNKEFAAVKEESIRSADSDSIRPVLIIQLRICAKPQLAE